MRTRQTSKAATKGEVSPFASVLQYREPTRLERMTVLDRLAALGAAIAREIHNAQYAEAQRKYLRSLPRGELAKRRIDAWRNGR